ncbi:MAG TPA: hypothetical protein VEI50_14900 [Nitrospiraceae bacterium]|jgi:hypothetical protein|nr:hypothetical protein [Nitrospiraceae bacterium]
MTTAADSSGFSWRATESWWVALAERLQVADRARGFFVSIQSGHLVERLAKIGGQLDYILFVLLRYWVPTVLPPLGRERLTKNDPDYWLESEQILKAAVHRLRELKPLIELLTMPNPLVEDAIKREPARSPVAEVELGKMLEGIAEVAGSYGGPDYTSVVKQFDPVPLRQTQPFKHNKKHSAELWVVFLLREHFRSLGLGKDRYWPLLAPICTAAGILTQNGQAYGPDELKSWWQKNWPRTYQQLDQKQETVDSGGAAYEQDFEWFQAWMEWQQNRPS